MSLLCPQEAGRLLYIGQNEWTHVNCAIWSAEVFEENDGSLKNVHAAVARGRQMVRARAWRGGQPSGSRVGLLPWRQLVSQSLPLSFTAGARYLFSLAQGSSVAQIVAFSLHVSSGLGDQSLEVLLLIETVPDAFKYFPYSMAFSCYYLPMR